jgi:acid phosphatase
LLIRHSSIQGNDDEFEETMSPFIQKIQRLQKDKKTKHLLPSKGEWAFLRKWDTPIVEKTLEEISERGKNDARVGDVLSFIRVNPRSYWPADVFQMLGKFFRKQYHTLMPSPDKHPKGKNATKDTYKVGLLAWDRPQARKLLETGQS